MKNGIIKLLIFAAGGAVGYLTASKVLKSKYEQLTDVRVASVKAAFKKNSEREQAKAEPEPEPKPETERQAYAKRVSELGYSEKQTADNTPGPRIISPDEYGEIDEYDQITLTYYSDGTLVDDAYRPMSPEDIEETIGSDSLKHFGEYDEDSVCVCNDRLKAYYEILADQQTYADILKEKPYLKHT